MTLIIHNRIIVDKELVPKNTLGIDAVLFI